MRIETHQYIDANMEDPDDKINLVDMSQEERDYIISDCHCMIPENEYEFALMRAMIAHAHGIDPADFVPMINDGVKWEFQCCDGEMPYYNIVDWFKGSVMPSVPSVYWIDRKTSKLYYTEKDICEATGHPYLDDVSKVEDDWSHEPDES